MTPQELKYSILHLAFQGRLAEQIEGDYQSNTFGFDIADPPFEIPETWKWEALGNCCEMYTGNSISESEKNAKYTGLAVGYDYIATKDITFEQAIEYDNGVRIPFESTFKRAYKGSILMCIEGGSAGRKIGILDRDVCFGNKLCMFQANKVLNTFLFYYLQSAEFKKSFAGNMTGIIGGVSIKKLKEILMPIPPLAEQKCIVCKIEELLPYIERYEQAWSKLEDFNKRFPTDMQKSILQTAIQGKLVEQRSDEGTGEELYQQIQAEKQRLIKAGTIKKEKPLPEITEGEKPFDIPESWKWVHFSELMNAMSTGPFGSMLHKSDYVTDGTPLVNPANIVNGKIVPSDKMMVSTDTINRLKSYVLHTGMIVMGRRGEMGRCAVVTDFEDGWLCGTGSFFMGPSTLLSVDFISTFFATPYAKTYLSGESIGTTMNNLNHTILSKMPVPLPPLAEQKRIVAKLEKILPLCEKLK